MSAESSGKVVPGGLQYTKLSTACSMYCGTGERKKNALASIKRDARQSGQGYENEQKYETMAGRTPKNRKKEGIAHFILSGSAAYVNQCP